MPQYILAKSFSMTLIFMIHSMLPSKLMCICTNQSFGLTTGIPHIFLIISKVKKHINLWKGHFQSNKRILWGLTPPKVFMDTRQRNDEVQPEINKSIAHAPMKGVFNQMECMENPNPPPPPLCIHLSNPTPTVRIKVFNVISLCEPHNALKA